MDAHDLIELEQRMTKGAENISHYEDAVAQSKQIVEFVSEEKKNLLAKFSSVYVRSGQSAAAADTLARSDENYLKEYNELKDRFARAQKHIAHWDALHCIYEAARSAFSASKSMMNIL